MDPEQTAAAVAEAPPPAAPDDIVSERADIRALRFRILPDSDTVQQVDVSGAVLGTPDAPAPDLDALLADATVKAALLEKLGVKPEAVAPAPAPAAAPEAPKPLDEAALRAQITQELREQAQRESQQARIAALREQLASKDDKIAAAAARQLNALYSEQDAAALAVQTQQEVARRQAVELFDRVFGIAEKDLPAEATQSYEAMQQFILQQSPRVQDYIKSELAKQKTNAEAVEQAKGAANFSKLLSQTRPVDTGIGGSGLNGSGQSFDEVERGWLEGKVSNETYYTARQKAGLTGGL